MQRKLFMVSEANLSIPRLTYLLRTLQQKYRWLYNHRQEIPSLEKNHQIVNEGPVDGEYFRKLIGIRKLLREVEGIGAQITDLSNGLVDFPARIFTPQDRSVLLYSFKDSGSFTT